jgi:regulator of replication initiation timing
MIGGEKMEDKKKQYLLDEISRLKEELEEADKTNDILQLENDDLRTEVMKADQRTFLVIEEIGEKINQVLEIGSKVDRLLEILDKEGRNED